MKKFSSSGMSLVELLVVLATTTILLSLSGGLIGSVFTTSQKFTITTTLSSLRNQYIQILTQSASWQQTISDLTINGSMSCLNNSADCSAVNSFTEFTPFDRIGRVAFNYDSSVAANGFSMDGSPCYSYSTSSPDPQCPIRIEFRWQPRCAVASCTKPEVAIQMEFFLSFPSGSPYAGINPAQYGYEFTRAGTFQVELPTSCNDDDVANGTDNAGIRTCSDPTNFSW